MLHGASLVWGALGAGVALAMIGVKAALDAWWTLSGIFAGGMLGLFLLGLISRRAGNPAAVTAALAGVLVYPLDDPHARIGGVAGGITEPVPQFHDRGGGDFGHPLGRAGSVPVLRSAAPLLRSLGALWAKRVLSRGSKGFCVVFPRNSLLSRTIRPAYKKCSSANSRLRHFYL